MGASPSVRIARVIAPNFGQVVVEATDGKRYFADLSSMSNVYCYPTDSHTWSQVAPDSDCLALVWVSRFEVHVDQVIALAFKVESIQQAG